MKVDILYWFIAPFFYSRLSHVLFIGIFTLWVGDGISREEFMQYGFHIFTDQPLALQIIISLLITDILQYWTHRMFHDATLWKFHAIHHSPTELDWLSGIRFHPFNLALHSTFVGVVVYFLGFSPIVYAVLAPFNILYSALVHANLNWTFGPLRYVFASPVFHRWHHTDPTEGGEKNFAPTFAFLDVLFGTFYMPTWASPKKFGVRESVPDTFVGQLLYPFRS
jgi:sterol desaturase/sphingolipid hydroxylase (fatty acid hydroxylase superfamily)